MITSLPLSISALVSRSLKVAIPPLRKGQVVPSSTIFFFKVVGFGCKGKTFLSDDLL
jgi:hypothetical protein